MSTPSPHCYATRLLAPFRGMLQTVETDSARALSDDGLHWQIQVRVSTRNPLWWGGVSGEGAGERLMVFAGWSAGEGLVQYPFDPMADLDQAWARAEAMVAALEPLHRQVPFAPADHLEHWLLDAGGRPLALVASRLDTEPAVSRTARWHAAEPPGAPLGEPLDEDTRALARAVNQAAAGSAWFRRRDHGLEPVNGGRFVPADQVPPLLLARHWADAGHRRLLDRYLHRQAPRLLTLHGLDETLRRELEQAAAEQPEAVERYVRLYPCIIDQALVRSTRVRARLRRGG